MSVCGAEDRSVSGCVGLLIGLSVGQSVCFLFLFLNGSAGRMACVSVFVSVDRSVCLSAGRSVGRSVCLSVGRSLIRSVGLPVRRLHPLVCRSVGHPLGPSVCLSVGRSVGLSVSLSVTPPRALYAFPPLLSPSPSERSSAHTSMFSHAGEHNN